MCQYLCGDHNNSKWKRPKLILDSPHENISLFKASDTAPSFGVYHISPCALYGQMILKITGTPPCGDFNLPRSPAFPLCLQCSWLPAALKSLCRTALFLGSELSASALSLLQFKSRHWWRRHCSKRNYIGFYKNQSRANFLHFSHQHWEPWGWSNYTAEGSEVFYVASLYRIPVTSMGFGPIVPIYLSRQVPIAWHEDDRGSCSPL